ncbi:unnamed protein product [Chrysodeixis includens]|uniref:Uncharacterized protein n=1 Tax=Chrysodeixis includens TaxID=689277 RepID=A0A9P0FVH4_CHRIL|nr:unnamed protein product [Chrysodeixis includens]
MNNKCIINFIFLYVISFNSLVTTNNLTVTNNLKATNNLTVYDICPLYKKGPSLNIQDLVGSWMTVYTQPKPVDCFKFHIRATTELEREQYIVKYGTFNGRVNWSNCLLQVETPLGKHFLQGNGSQAGLMENIIILEENAGDYSLQNQSADIWTVFGRRGSEVLMIRDCYGDTAAAFARAPYWPTAPELSAIFHRSGIAALTHGRLLCEPQDHPTKQHIIHTEHEQHKRNC